MVDSEPEQRDAQACTLKAHAAWTTATWQPCLLAHASETRLPEMDALFHQEALVEALAAAFPQGEGEGQGEGQGLRLSRGTRGRTLKLQRNAGMFVCARAFVRVGGGVRLLSFSVPKVRLGASVRCISQVHTCGGAVCFPFVIPRRENVSAFFAGSWPTFDVGAGLGWVSEGKMYVPLYVGIMRVFADAEDGCLLRFRRVLRRHYLLQGPAANAMVQHHPVTACCGWRYLMTVPLAALAL